MRAFHLLRVVSLMSRCSIAFRESAPDTVWFLCCKYVPTTR